MIGPLIPALPRRFQLRGPDEIEAHGVFWPDGSASIKWIGDRDHLSFVVWPHMDRALAAHFNGAGDPGRPLTLEWIDHE